MADDPPNFLADFDYYEESVKTKVDLFACFRLQILAIFLNVF